MRFRNIHAGLLAVLTLACLASSANAYRDLETGTFLTRDPAGFVDGPNVYSYVRQNPWTKFDPQGLFEADGDPRERSTTITRRGNDGVARVLQPGMEFRNDEVGLAYEASQTGDWEGYYAKAKAAGLDQATAKKFAVLGRDPVVREIDNRNMDMGAAMGFPAQLSRTGNRFTRIQQREQAKITDSQAKNPGGQSQRTTINQSASEAVALTPAQAQKLKQFNRKTPANAKPAKVDKLGEDQALFTAESTGQVPGSKKVYQKSVAPDGETTSFTKTTVTPEGRMHKVTDALANPEKVVHSE